MSPRKLCLLNLESSHPKKEKGALSLIVTKPHLLQSEEAATSRRHQASAQRPPLLPHFYQHHLRTRSVHPDSEFPQHLSWRMPFSSLIELNVLIHLLHQLSDYFLSCEEFTILSLADF